MERTGKVAFVTGGLRDIGAGIVRALAAAGVDIAVSYDGHREGAGRTAALVAEQGAAVTSCSSISARPPRSTRQLTPS